MIKTKKYSHIDSIRGYAVLLVLATHVFAFGGSEGNPDVVLSRVLVQARMGVMLFYIISALTLFLSLGQKNKTEHSPVRNFFIRRIFRIVPLFYIVCIYRILFNQFDPLNILGTVTFTNGFMPSYIHSIVVGGWSIAVETTFYLMVPFLFKYITNIKRSVIFIILSIVLSILLRSLAFRFLSPYISNEHLLSWTLVWLPMQLPVFAIGIFLYFLFFKPVFEHEQTMFFKMLSYMLIFTAIYFFIIASYSDRLFVYENLALSIPLMLFVSGMTFYPDNYFNNRITQFFGKISYSFYLLHPIIIYALMNAGVASFINARLGIHVGFAACYLVMLAATSIVAYLSYRFIEQPFQRLGISIIDKSEKKATIRTNALKA